MAKKQPIEIGMRFAEELLRIFPTNAEAVRALRCGKNAPAMWQSGTTPSYLHIAKIYQFGGDIVYILTGHRSDRVNAIDQKLHTRPKLLEAMETISTLDDERLDALITIFKE